MAVLQDLEKTIGGWFKDLPKLPESSKEALVKFWPWLSLIGGILQLLAAWALWKLASWADRLNDAVNELSRIYSGAAAVGPSSMEKTVIYMGVLLLLVDAVILLMAYSPLKQRARRGWDLLFLGALVNAAYSVIQIFTYHRGIGSFIFGLIGSVIGFYLLFQVREKFSGGRSMAGPHHTT